MTAISRVVPALFFVAICFQAVSDGRAVLAREDSEEQQEPRPTEIVRTTSDQVLDILRDPNLAGDEREPERRRQFREAIAEKFDWTAIAQHGLGVHWRKRTAEEREEFTGLFRQLLEQIYFKQLTIHGVEAKVRCEKELVKGNRAVVRTIAEKKGVETRIDYVMRKAPEKPETTVAWLVYDVKVEGVSLLLSFREQFNEIIVNGGFADVMEKLKQKVETPEQSEDCAEK